MASFYHATTPREDLTADRDIRDPWTPALTALWDRIARHDFEPDHPLNFTRRLARDKDWTLAYARGAILEYRRFCFLTCAGAGPMTPPEEIDEVWHQHLTYSRDYWEVWCKTALGAPLHHDPTLGGPAQQSHFRTRYAVTLQTYERFFGPPPPLYWPATHVRFGPRPRFRTVDSFRWLLMPHPRMVWRTIKSLAGRSR